MAKGRKSAIVGRGTIFVLAYDMRTAEAWADAHGLRKDRYRYVVNTDVFDVMGPNDTYAYVSGVDRTGDLYVRAMGIIRDRNLEWCGKDPYILVRDENGNVPPVTDVAPHDYDRPPGAAVIGPDGEPRDRPCLQCGRGSGAEVHRAVALMARCTCEGGPRSVIEVHDPDCSLHNTGVLT